MSSKHTHSYRALLAWTGNRGTGTSAYEAYDRDYEISVPGKTPIAGSSDPAFRGDAARYNPEDLLVASLAACHMLWYLHLCSEAGIVVTSYEDDASGEIETGADGGGEFISVTLRPEVIVDNDSELLEQAHALHAEAHGKCFIARSVSFPVTCEPEISVSENRR